MGWLTYPEWQKRFQTAARRDHYQEIEELCEVACYGAGEEGEPLMSGTIEMVAWLAGCRSHFQPECFRARIRSFTGDSSIMCERQGE